MTKTFRPMSLAKSRGGKKLVNTGSPASHKVYCSASSELLSSHNQAVVVSTPPLESTGFLGPTSYRSLMNEGVSDSNPAPAETDPTTQTIDPKQVELGLRILHFLADDKLLLRNILRHVFHISRMPIIPEVLMLPALDILWDSLGDYATQNEARRLRTVVRIFENSYLPIPIANAMKATELSQLISGKNVRWETIGSVITIAAIGLIHMPERDVTYIDFRKRTKDEILAQLLEVTDHLLPLSNALPVVNELMVCLKYFQMMLASYRFGDSSRWLYSSIGELSSCIYATGIHQYNIPLGQYPGFINLWRRRCFAAVYSMDKTIATTLGRPPSMNRYYCVLEPPLDIDDDISHQEYERSLPMINSNGWNSDEKRRPSSIIRLRFLLATIREEILELHLGVNGAGMEEKARVMRRLQSIWEACPHHMKYSPDMWNGRLSCQDILSLLSNYLDYLHSMFLLHRLTAQSLPEEKPQELLLVAKEILSTVVVINEERERLREVRSDFSSIFLPYGLPSAELLAMELLHPSNSPSAPSHPRLPRAEIIRELTLYISCLSWVARPGSGNFGFCKRVKAKLTRILDQIIDPSYATPSSNDNRGATASNVSGSYPESLDSDSTMNNLLLWDDGSHWDPGFDLFSTQYGKFLSLYDTNHPLTQSPPPAYSAPPPSIKPCIIPQITKTFGGANNSPLVRAYAPELAPLGISQTNFLAFIGGLNEAVVTHPGLQAAQAVGTIVGFVPSHIARIVMNRVSLAAGAGAAGVSIVRTKQFLKSANENLFNRRGMQVRMVKGEYVLSLVGCCTVISDSLLVPDVRGRRVSEHDVLFRRMEAFGGAVMELSFDVKAPIEQQSWAKNLGVAQARRTEQKQLRCLQKEEEKRLEKEDKTSSVKGYGERVCYLGDRNARDGSGAKHGASSENGNGEGRKLHQEKNINSMHITPL
ncbi:hypothetical protein BBP40_000606 [Aspergillus hancockii]|nr:hypothetical protein BBP40_000606 [Aspergillus hancockii]